MCDTRDELFDNYSAETIQGALDSIQHANITALLEAVPCGMPDRRTRRPVEATHVACLSGLTVFDDVISIRFSCQDQVRWEVKVTRGSHVQRWGQPTVELSWTSMGCDMVDALAAIALYRQAAEHAALVASMLPQELREWSDLNDEAFATDVAEWLDASDEAAGYHLDA